MPHHHQDPLAYEPPAGRVIGSLVGLTADKKEDEFDLDGGAEGGVFPSGFSF